MAPTLSSIPFIALSLLSLSFTLAQSAPLKCSLTYRSFSNAPSNNTLITLPQLTHISPKSSNSSFCSSSLDNQDPSIKEECRTNDQALPWVNEGFERYGIKTAGEKAAIVSLEVFESGGWEFNRNHFPPPGRPGQGTRALLMFPFIYSYALSIPSLKPQVFSLLPNPPPPSNSTDPQPSNQTQSSILNLVLPDQYAFASASWYYVEGGPEKCRNEELIEGLKKGSEEGWESYIVDCVGTTVTDDRKAVWQLAIQALTTTTGNETRKGEDS